VIDIEKQKRHGIRQARKTIANILKKKKDGVKLTQEDHDKIAAQQTIIDRWQRAGAKGWKL
jgi:hypothetical protein